jgi:hypothetical protein
MAMTAKVIKPAFVSPRLAARFRPIRGMAVGAADVMIDAVIG